MKKFLYSLGIIALMASCTEDYTDWAGLKTNDPETAKNIEVAASSNLAVDFGAEELAEVLDLAQVTVTTDDEYTVDYKVMVTDGDLTANVPVAEVTEDNVIKVKSEDLLNAVKSVYGQTGEATNVKVIVDAIVNVGGQAFERQAETSITATVPKPEFEWEYIYGIGNGTDWSRVCPLWSPNVDGVYDGFIYIEGAFKFRSHEDTWDSPDWGGGASAGTLREGGDITDPVETGYYAVHVDLSTMRYELGTKIETIGVIGDGGNWDTDKPLTYNKATGAWEGELNLDGGEIKFRANNDWAINWGGDVNALTQGGANIAIEGGKYKIQLFAFCDNKAHVVITAIGR